MKAVVLFILSIAICDHMAAQYTVTKVNGYVINKTTGAPLMPGTKLRDNDLLEFSSTNDMVRVIVSGKGVYIISPGPRKDGGESVIVEMLKSALKIKSKEGYLSGRSEEDEVLPGVLETDPTVNAHLLITDINKYQFDRKLYDVRGGSRFFMQKQVQGQKAVVQSLQTVGDTLVIRRDDFNGEEGTGYKIGFFNAQKNSSQLLADVLPAFDSTGLMDSLILLMVDEYRGKEKEMVYRECYEEVYEALGKPPVILFRDKFETIFSTRRSQ